jgi:hypothetical protein
MFMLAEIGFVMQSSAHESELGGREFTDHSNANGAVGAVSAGARADYAFCRDHGDIGGGGGIDLSLEFAGTILGALAGDGCGRGNWGLLYCAKASA